MITENHKQKFEAITNFDLNGMRISLAFEEMGSPDYYGSEHLLFFAEKLKQGFLSYFKAFHSLPPKEHAFYFSKEGSNLPDIADGIIMRIDEYTHFINGENQEWITVYFRLKN